jgi:coenzyme F420-reducing hydrogenase alpha subunit
MRKFGQEIIEATAGKKIHGTGAVPGGINRNLPIEARDRFLRPDRRDGGLGAGRAGAGARDYTLEHRDGRRFASFPSQLHVAGARRRRARSLRRQLCARSTADGGDIFDQLDYTKYHEHLVEDVRAWSYMKFPFIKDLGPETGWYRVGPLARMNTASFIDTPLAEKPRKDAQGRHQRRAEQRDAGQPLGAHDRGAALRREDPRTAADPGSAGHRPHGDRRAARGRHRRHRGAARQRSSTITRSMRTTR